jgi:GTP cyclohydrolase II
MRLPELMPDVLHWLGIERIDRLVSMSHLKYAQIVASGIAVIERMPIPEELIPAEAQVEIDAKKASGYYADDIPDPLALRLPKGRALGD